MSQKNTVKYLILLLVFVLAILLFALVLKVLFLVIALKTIKICFTMRMQCHRQSNKSAKLSLPGKATYCPTPTSLGNFWYDVTI